MTDTTKLVTIFELLDMPPEDGERLMDELGEMFVASDGPAELCKRVVDKYGVDAVFTSICLRMVLEQRAMVKVDNNWRLQCPERN